SEPLLARFRVFGLVRDTFSTTALGQKAKALECCSCRCLFLTGQRGRVVPMHLFGDVAGDLHRNTRPRGLSVQLRARPSASVWCEAFGDASLRESVAGDIDGSRSLRPPS